MRALLLDLDGTLVDTHGMMFRCFTHAVQQCFGGQANRDDWARHAGMPLRDVFRGCLGDRLATDSELDQLVDSYRNRMDKIESQEVRLYPGIRSVLESLTQDGVRLALVTTKLRRNAEGHLRSVGLQDRFEFLVTSDDCRYVKPHPEPFQKALERLGLRPEQAVAVGDTEHDIRSAQAAGISAAAALWGTVCREALVAAGPDHLLDQPEDLEALVDSTTRAKRAVR